jgi:hypothetical protein
VADPMKLNEFHSSEHHLIIRMLVWNAPVCDTEENGLSKRLMHLADSMVGPEDLKYGSRN